MFSFLDKTNLPTNIKKVESRLSYILQNPIEKNKVINTLISYCKKYENTHNRNKEFKKLFIFVSHFELHLIPYVLQEKDKKADQIRILFANSYTIYVRSKNKMKNSAMN